MILICTENLFNQYSIFGFFFSSCFSLGMIGWLTLASRRVIHKLEIHKSGEKCRILFNSIFGIKRNESFQLRDFTGFSKSRYGYFTFDSTHQGMFFLDLENNIQKDYPGNSIILKQICNGHNFKLI